jgi:hypothetical protein
MSMSSMTGPPGGTVEQLGLASAGEGKMDGGKRPARSSVAALPWHHMWRETMTTDDACEL